jgi:small subunit ribosomal protein S7
MRRKLKIKKEIPPDYQYNSVLVTKFINHLMYDGKKSVARKVLYSSFGLLKKDFKVDDPISIFEEAIKNVSPALEVRSRRVGGANYQVPREVKADRRVTLAMRWIIAASRAKKGMPMAKRLADEFIAASKNEGAAIKKKETTHKMAEANRAFAHFAW